MSEVSERPERHRRTCRAEARSSMLKRALLAFLTVALLGSCSAPSTDTDANSNETDADTGEERSTASSRTADAEAPTPFSLPPLVTTEDTAPSPLSPQAATLDKEKLIHVGTDGNARYDEYAYRVHLRYANYLGRRDMSSVYMVVAVRSYCSPYSSDLMSQILRRLPHYDFVLLSVYEDERGDFFTTMSYADSEEVAQAYREHLCEHADEFVNAAMEEGSSPAEIEQAEKNFRNNYITQFNYRNDWKVRASPAAANIPPWIYSDRKGKY